MPSAPEPANRSRTSAPSMLGPTMLKIACFTMPWVGRMFLGALRRRPRASPPATRSLDIYLVLDADLAVAPHGPDPARGWHLALEAYPAAGRNRDQQASAGLRVAKHQLLDLGKAVPIDSFAVCGVVAPAARGKDVPVRQIARALQKRHSMKIDVRTAGQVGRSEE